MNLSCQLNVPSRLRMSGAVTPFPTCQHVVYGRHYFEEVHYLYITSKFRVVAVFLIFNLQKYFISSIFLSLCKVSASKSSLLPCVNIQQLSPFNRKLNNIFFSQQRPSSFIVDFKTKLTNCISESFDKQTFCIF